MKKEIGLSGVAVLLAVCLAGCSTGGQAAATAETAAQYPSAETVAATPEPVVYTGPLYEVTATRLDGSAQAPHFDQVYPGKSRESRINYGGLVLWENYRENNTLVAGFPKYTNINGVSGKYVFTDADCNEIQVAQNDDYLEFLAGYNGYRLFSCGPVPKAALAVFDESGQRVNTTLGYTPLVNYYSGANLFYLGLKSGWQPMWKVETDEYGFLNLYTGEWHPLPEGIIPLGSGMRGSMEAGTMSTSFYSDGLAWVCNNKISRTYDQSSMNFYDECPVVGFVDETGAFAFRFDELDAFAGKLVVDVTGFYNGTCMVAGRQDDGVQTAVEGDNVEGRYEGLDLEFFYEIDKTGNILREVTYDDYVAFRQKILPALGIRDPELGNYALYHTDSIQLADGLTLSVDNPLSATEVILEEDLGGFTLQDCNGTDYPLDDYLIRGIYVGDDGTVLMECTDAVEAATAESAYQAEQCTAWYKLNYTWIAPEGYRVPDGTQKNLSSQGLEELWDYEADIQYVPVSLLQAEDVHDLVLTFTTPAFTSSYTVPEDSFEDYSDVAIMGRTLGLHMAVLSQEEVTITAQWNDSQGNPHQGVYDGMLSLKETA